MQTRRDQLHAYRFQNRRALAALVAGEPNVLEPPMRRLTVTTISGIMIAILIAVVFALVGLFKPATGDKWKDPATVIVEQPSGARYVLLDGQLHPVLNFTSAVLAAAGDSGSAQVVDVDRSDIAKTPRGATIGIPGAPDTLPTRGNLVTSTWTLCSQLKQNSSIDPVQAHVTLLAGSTGGARAVPSGAGIVVTDVGTRRSYLLYQGRRLLIADAGVATTLRLQQVPAVPVATAFLEGVPQGPDLRAPTVAGAGQPASYPIGAQRAVVGQLLHVSDPDQYFVVLRDGVTPLDPVQTAVLRTLRPPGATSPLPPLEVSQSAELAVPQSKTDGPALVSSLSGLPNQLPSMTSVAADASGICVEYAKGSGQPTLAVPPRLLASTASVSSVGESSAAATNRADEVVLPPGGAALIRSSSGAKFTYLLAAPGLRFALGGAQTQGTLGYDGVTPVTLADQLVQLIPTGPQLDAAAARTPVPTR